MDPHRALARILAAALLALAVTAEPVAAQEPPPQSVYGLRSEGHISWNGTLLDALPGDFDDDHGSLFVFAFSSGFTAPTAGGFFLFTTFGLSSDDFDDRWTDLVIVGADRWVLRADGRLEFDGKKHASLSHAWWTADWVALDADAARVAALRRDGRVTRLSTGPPSGVTVDLPRDGSFFTDVRLVGAETFALRADGAVFALSEPAAPRVAFVGGDGPSGHADGGAVDSSWTTLGVDALGAAFVALRRDGLVHAAPIAGLETGESPTVLATLPPPDANPFHDVTLAQLVYGDVDEYVDLAVLDAGARLPGAGDWLALRGDGSIFTTGGALLVDHDGGGPFCDLTTLGERFAVLDSTGRVFLDAAPGPVFDLPQTGYLRAALSDDEPDVSAAKNGRPRVARYRAKLVEGQAAEIPVIATDTNAPSDALVVEPLLPLPDGVTYDAGARVFSVDGTQPTGGFPLRVRVDDGVGKPRKATLRVQVAPLDESPTNRKPQAARIGRARALVGAELALPLIVSDRDGDEVTVTPDDDKGLFADTDATFDADTLTLRWTPTPADVGRTKAVFVLDDGTAQRKIRIALNVKQPLPAGG